MAGVFNTLRERFAWILLIFIAGGILLFVFSDVVTRIGTIVQGNPNAVGKVLGEELEVRELQAAIEILVNQAEANGQTVDENLRRQITDQAWEQLVNKRIFEKEFEGLGIEISTSHLQSMVFGVNPSNAARQVFGNPQTGEYDPARAQQLYAQAGQNPQLKQQLQQVEEYLIENRRQELYQKGLGSLMLVSKARAEQQLHLDRDTRDAQFLAVTFASIADSTITVTDRDFEEYYRENRNKYKQNEEQAELSYVFLPKLPTGRDSVEALGKLLSLKQEFETTEDDSLFASAKSDLAEPAAFRPVGTLSSAELERLGDAKAGTVLGPVQEGRFYKLIKVSEFKDDTLASVEGRHIFIQPTGTTSADSLAARSLADSLATVATDENFAGLVPQFSNDNQTRFSGGELGWVARGQFGPAFDKAAAEAPLSRFTVIKGDYGYHVLQVRKKENRLVRLATISSEIYPGKETLDSLARLAAQVDAKFTEIGNFNEAARLHNLDVRTSPTISPSNLRIPGLEGANQLASWALTNDLGARTGIRDLNNGILVGFLSKRSSEGYQSLADVRETIQPEVINRKKASLIQAKLGAVTDLNQGREAYGEGAFVSRAQDITYTRGFIAGIGNDPKVTGTLFGIDTSRVSKPVVGLNGVYMLSATKATPAELTPEQIQGQKQQMARTLSGTLSQRMNAGLRKAAEVADWRYRFGF